MIYDNEDEVIEETFESFLKRYQISLEASMRGSDFIFDYVHLLYQKYNKISLFCGGWYIDSPDWIKKQKSNNKYHL